jgi:hypothetical protein
MTAPHKLCINCRWFRCPDAIAYARCAAPQVPTAADPVSGVVGPKILFCVNHRESTLDYACGAAGKWFEPKEATP